MYPHQMLLTTLFSKRIVIWLFPGISIFQTLVLWKVEEHKNKGKLFGLVEAYCLFPTKRITLATLNNKNN